MSLLHEIRDAAVDGKTGIATVLRKCRVLEAKLKNEDFRTWITRELHGYPADAELPTYRILAAPAVGHFVGPLNTQYKDMTIPAAVMPERTRELAIRVKLGHPIAQIEAIVDGSTETEGELSFPWPGDLIALMQQKKNFANGYILIDARQTISRSQLVGVIDTVRSRILDFALEMAEEVPEVAESSAPSPNERDVVQHIVNTHIYGNVGNVANASPGAVQTSTVVTKGDLSALVLALREVGVPEPAVRALEAVIKEEAPLGGVGPKTSGWMTKAREAVEAGTWKLGTGVSAQVLTKLLTSYMGWGD